MNKKNSPAAGHNKKSFLNNPVEHIDITKFDARKIIDSMGKMSFTSRDTANAASIFNEMILDKNCSIFSAFLYISIQSNLKCVGINRVTYGPYFEI